MNFFSKIKSKLISLYSKPPNIIKAEDIQPPKSFKHIEHQIIHEINLIKDEGERYWSLEKIKKRLKKRIGFPRTEEDLDKFFLVSRKLKSSYVYLHNNKYSIHLIDDFKCTNQKLLPPSLEN